MKKPAILCLPARRRFVLAALLAGVALTPAARAATYTWNGGNSFSNNWSTRTNWLNSSVPVSAVDTDLIYGALDRPPRKRPPTTTSPIPSPCAR